MNDVIPLALQLTEALGHTHAEIAITRMGIQLTEWHFVLDDDFAHFIKQVDHVIQGELIVANHRRRSRRLHFIRYRSILSLNSL
ncbi:hypothetical protein D3C71_1883760 [compost metagenome]